MSEEVKRKRRSTVYSYHHIDVSGIPIKMDEMRQVLQTTGLFWIVVDFKNIEFDPKTLANYTFNVGVDFRFLFNDMPTEYREEFEKILSKKLLNRKVQYKDLDVE